MQEKLIQKAKETHITISLDEVIRLIETSWIAGNDQFLTYGHYEHHAYKSEEDFQAFKKALSHIGTIIEGQGSLLSEKKGD